MKNSVFKAYADKKYDKDSNFTSIKSKIKSKKKIIYLKRFFSVAAVFVIAIVGFTFYKKDSNVIKNDSRFVISKSETATGSVETMLEDGYMEKVNMDYITQDGISMKVDSIVITDDTYEIKLSIKSNEKINIETIKNSDTTYIAYRSLDCSYVVYDENNNIYSSCESISRMNNKNSLGRFDSYLLYVYDKLGIKYDENNVFDFQFGNGGHDMGKIVNEEENMMSLTLHGESSKGFPRSKKIYITLTDLGIMINNVLPEEDGKKQGANVEFESLSDAEWIFEIDIPEKFYDRETIDLDLNDEISGLQISKFNVTEKKIVLEGNLKGLGEFIALGRDDTTGEWSKQRDESFYISDSEGNRYLPVNFNSSDDEFSAMFNIDKNKIENKLYLNVVVDGVLYTKEIIIK